MDDKTYYVVHYKNLRLYYSLKMKLTKIHKVLKFKQSDWIKVYINFNTGKRKKMLPIVWKKYFLNWRLIVPVVKQLKILEKESGKKKKKKRRNRQKKKTVKIVSNDNNEKDYLKHARKPTFISIKIFDKNYAAIYQTKPIKF